MKREPESPDEQARTRERELMVRQQILERGIDTPCVLEAFLSVPRHFFVPPEYVKQAYDDRPLYIGHGQTISQPYMVALMTDSLELKGDEKVLDIGTGSGYQAAILAELAREVHTVERIEELSLGARRLLDDLGYDNVTFHVGDGTLGWTDAAPFDAILVAAAAPGVPDTLKEQLGDAGRLVIPVGPPYSQTLRLVTKTSRGFQSRDICPCIFVKLIGAEGYPD